ncbi:hypothetical protein [Smaragdicoccus niigatensis]|uniref:hypothetical protein n=1 Tax=Smaragdicoccus niigatensis TaxID=359359 RepID=UPI00035E013E|nr:hypothetical protein [Smaragdicoccus niigatensis]
MRRSRLDRLDEGCLTVGSVDEPWTIQLEVRLLTRLDEQRLTEAIRRAMTTHPIARARLQPPRPNDFRFWWLIPDAPGKVPLTVADGDVTELRDQLVSRAPDLKVRTFDALLVHADDGDHLILNIHHAAGDGMAAYRLMTSILRNYSGTPDPVPDFDPVDARNVRTLIGAHGWKDRWDRGRQFGKHLFFTMWRPVRIAPQNGHNAGGYGCELIRFTAAETKQVVARRPPGVTVNDLLLGGLARTVRRWNDARGVRPRRVTITMPMNVRPDEWQHEVFGNFASYVTVRVMKKEQRDLQSATLGAQARTKLIKQRRAQGILVDISTMSSLVPVRWKQLIADKPLVGDRAVDTTWLTNLGRLGVPDLEVADVWFSPPATMPMGANIGVVTINGEMFVALRYRHPQFDREAANQFSQLFRETLLNG